jgi:hypothetical protein
MTDKSKKTFLLTTIVGSFLIYSIIYYAQVLKDAPYNLKEFKSFTIKYGTKDSMVNYYNSATGEYTYLNKNDSLIKKHLFLSKSDIDSLHKEARIFGFWDFPANELNNDSTNANYKKVPRYIIQFNYKRKSKLVQFDANYNGPAKLVDANRGLITKIRDILSGAEERQK